MSLTLKEVEHIAFLARLNLTSAEKKLYQQQLSDILDHVAKLQKLDTTGVSTSSSVLPPAARLREDVRVEGLSTDEALINAPETEDDQFKVPPVLE